MASSIEKTGNPPTDGKGEASSRAKSQAAGMPAAERARKRAVRRGANVHIQDEDQAPTGKNAGDERAVAEVAASESRKRGKARTVAGASG